MICGHGDIASALMYKPDRIYFASGVSNSSCIDLREFQREKKLLLEQDKYRRIIYFSSLCIYYCDTPYARHKLEMEAMVKHTFNDYCIMRLGNITWGNNPNTIINYLTEKIKNNESYEVKDTFRYLITKEEFLHWIDLIPDFNTEMNVPGRKMHIKEIERMIKINLSKEKYEKPVHPNQ